jgi:hypothetical protein
MCRVFHLARRASIVASCEHTFVTSDGSAYTRFKRALGTGNLNLIRAAAAELPRVGLADALEVCLLMRDQDERGFERAAVRWLGRFALEARGVTIEALERAAGALRAMPQKPEAAMEILSGLCVRHGVDR